MKHLFVLLVALMSAVTVNAKTVRGYVSDKEGNPVVGMKMVVVNADNPSKKSVAVTDEEGYFSMPVPEDLDTSDLVEVIAGNGARVVRYRETSTGIRIVIEPSQKREKALEQICKDSLQFCKEALRLYTGRLKCKCLTICVLRCLEWNLTRVRA